MALWPATGADSHPGHGPVVIEVANLAYTPAKVTIAESDFVLYDWGGPDTNHSVTADADQAMAFDSDPGKSANDVSHPVNDGFSVRFDKAGTYTFHCKVHSFMKGTIEVLAPPPGSAPGPVVKPTLSNVRVRRAAACSSCRRVAVIVRFTVNEAVSMRATLRRLAGARPAGRILKEIDFSGPPGANRKRLDLGRRRRGAYQLRLVAIDQSTGTATKPAVARVVVR